MTQTTTEVFAASTVHEAAGRIGALPSRLKPVYPAARVHGRAFPVLCPVGENLWLHRAVYAARPGDVLVVATTAVEEYGYWGEILSEAAAARSLGGLVIDGGVRDVEVLPRTGFPVFAATTCLRGTGKSTETGGGFPQEVVLGGVRVRRGDLVIGDQDGVVVVPADSVDDVLRASREREEKEAAIIAQLREGASTIGLYGFPAVGSVEGAAS